MSASSNNSEIQDGDKKSHKQKQQQSQLHHVSGMTPSIITTINNTSPNLPISQSNANSNCNTLTRNRRANEPYESYIEDSFVGHWEHEDDDPLDEYHEGSNGNASRGAHEDDSALHPSTIEFDFDSFGPESIIYAPTATTKSRPTRIEEDQLNESQSTEKREEVQDKPHQDLTQHEHEQKQQQQQHQQQLQREYPTTSGESRETCALNTNLPECLVDFAQIDLKVIEPYKKVISHAGYCHHSDQSAPPPKPGEPAPAIIVFSACYLPDRSRRDYDYVMDHLFLYVLSSLQELIADDYILIYLHNTQPSPSVSAVSKSSTSNNTANDSSSGPEENQHQNNLPTFTWMKRCYQMIDRRLRKNLKMLYLVKPTFWLKTIVIMCKPFISAKFSRKLRFIEDMDGLKKCLPVDQLILPASAQNI